MDFVKCLEVRTTTCNVRKCNINYKVLIITTANK